VACSRVSFTFTCCKYVKDTKQIQENPSLEPLYSLKTNVGLAAPLDMVNPIYKNTVMAGLFQAFMVQSKE
jgi:hypothetical protein